MRLKDLIDGYVKRSKGAADAHALLNMARDAIINYARSQIAETGVFVSRQRVDSECPHLATNVNTSFDLAEAVNEAIAFLKKREVVREPGDFEFMLRGFLNQWETGMSKKARENTEKESPLRRGSPEGGSEH